MIRTLIATRYITPLREGGSLPAIVGADDGELYVMKFVGAGQGAKALIAELICGQIGRALGLAVPEIVFMELDPALGRSEGDPEVQALIRASVGLNLAMRYLPLAFAFNPLLKPPPQPELASAVVWFDAYISNVDRTVRNTNMLLWQSRMWLIDHGASLYFHHTRGWHEDYPSRSNSPFELIKQHVLLPFAGSLAQADAGLRQRLTLQVIHDAVAAIPESWLSAADPFVPPASQRAAYTAYLARRLEASSVFVEEAERARAALL